MSQENVIPGTAKDRALLNFSLGDSPDHDYSRLMNQNLCLVRREITEPAVSRNN